MPKLFWILFLILPLGAWSQEVEEPWELQDSEVLNAWLPFSISSTGDISFFKSNPADAFVFSPLMQLGGSFDRARFNIPERVDAFTLEEKLDAPEWLEVHHRRYQLGAGLGVITGGTLKLGLVPFKGANQKLIRTSNGNHGDDSLSLLPKSLEKIAEWNVGDQGTFETYGGVEFQFAPRMGVLNVITGTIALQNEFTLELKKLTERFVSLELSEGKVNRRKLLFSVEALSYSFNKVKGHKLLAEFVLDLEDLEHHRLYESALKGKLIELQKVLPHTAQRIEFSGSSQKAYAGIPILIGKKTHKGEYEFTDEESSAEMHFNSKNNDGIFLPKRDIHRFVTFTDSKVVLFWASEMKKVKGKALDKHFMSIGRSLGLEGFESRVDEKQNFGSVLAQVGLTLDEEKLTDMKLIKSSQLDSIYADRCEELRLKCRQSEHRAKLLKKLNKLLRKSWDQSRKDIGSLLMKNPALIHSLLKSMNIRTQAYFLFLSSRFKSQEGSAVIEF